MRKTKKQKLKVRKHKNKTPKRMTRKQIIYYVPKPIQPYQPVQPV
jgi:hypothetical protein